MSTLLLLLACAGVPETAPAVDYDHVACHHCAMLVSDPSFAAQLVTSEGDRRVYDDPACLFQDLEKTHPKVERMWFRDSRGAEERWIPWNEAAFVPAKGAPMNGGYAAVPSGTPGAVGFGEASGKAIGGGP